jgi:hypothetical protein
MAHLRAKNRRLNSSLKKKHKRIARRHQAAPAPKRRFLIVRKSSLNEVQTGDISHNKVVRHNKKVWFYYTRNSEAPFAQQDGRTDSYHTPHTFRHIISIIYYLLALILFCVIAPREGAKFF